MVEFDARRTSHAESRTAEKGTRGVHQATGSNLCDRDRFTKRGSGKLLRSASTAEAILFAGRSGAFTTAGFKTSQWGDYSEREHEITESIARRAYELFESRGFTHGLDGEDWKRAQSEILLNVPVDIKETENELVIRAEVPGFSEENLEVQVAPHSVFISGMRQESAEQNEGKTVYSERRCDRIFRIFDLPSHVDPATMDLTLNDGILEIKVSKVAIVQQPAPLVRRASA